jgi:hypothetical protein
VAELDVGGPARERYGLDEQIDRSEQVTLPHELPCLGDALLEPPGVDRGPVDRQPVTARRRFDDLTIGIPKRSSQTKDVRLNGLDGGGRRIVRPQRVDDRVDPDDVARLTREKRQQATTVGARYVDGSTLGFRHQRSQDRHAQ